MQARRAWRDTEQALIIHRCHQFQTAVLIRHKINIAVLLAVFGIPSGDTVWRRLDSLPYDVHGFFHVAAVGDVKAELRRTIVCMIDNMK